MVGDGQGGRGRVNTQRLNEFEEHVCSGNQEVKKNRDLGCDKEQDTEEQHLRNRTVLGKESILCMTHVGNLCHRYLFHYLPHPPLTHFSLFFN